ncbi:Uncharacterised protein [Citrobacter freundii]|nr:Uncharacterised protein [Citrobacter freundii]
MVTNHEEECVEWSTPQGGCGPGACADDCAVSAPESASHACPLADFARRVRACETQRRLDMLHTLMLRTVPVRLRADYIALLNQRDEELSFPYTETVAGMSP